MQEITLKNGNVVIYNNDKDLVLKQGAIVKTIGKSFTQQDLIDLRNTKTTTDASGNIITTEDITFTSKSAIATFIQGGATNGNRYFEKYLGASPVKTKNTTESSPTTENESTNSSVASSQEIADKIITFCKDFDFEPLPRCLNSLLYESNPSQFIVDTMRLTNYPQELVELAESKFKSTEWKQLIQTLKTIKPTHDRFNRRLEIYYGKAGTGKTMLATTQYPNADKVVASASADPDDLFTAFNPETKKYELTALGSAMENGKPIILDEANLYNRVVLERLQGITDTTDSIKDRTFTIKIADGFKVIITMNLETNMGKFPLPSPLVERASVIKHFDNVKLDWVW